jgi:hypothetical protein
MTKIKIGLIFVSVLGLTTITQASFAQLRPEKTTGSNITAKPKAVVGKSKGEFVRGFGKCMISGYPENAKKLLDNSDPLSLDKLTIFGEKGNVKKALGMENCLSRQVGYGSNALGFKFNDLVLRSILLEEAYLLANKAQPAIDTKNTVARNFVTKDPELNRAKALAEFSDCVVEKNPSLSDQILRTVAETKEAQELTKALAPTMSECIFEGQKIELTATSVRGFVADGMYHRFGANAFENQKK